MWCLAGGSSRRRASICRLTVAVREAWQLTGDRQLTDPFPHWLGQDDDDVPADALARIADREHLAQLAALKPAEREALILQAAGRARSPDPPGRRPQLSPTKPGFKRKRPCGAGGRTQAAGGRYAPV